MQSRESVGQNKRVRKRRNKERRCDETNRWKNGSVLVNTDEFGVEKVVIDRSKGSSDESHAVGVPV